MIRDITLGQYYQTDSFVHRLDPRTKLIATFVYIISLFIYTNIYVYFFAIIYLAIAIAASKVPLKFIMRGMQPVIFLIVFTALFNVLFIKGEVIASIWIIEISKEGLIKAGYMIVRIILLVISSSLMTLTTTPNNLTDGIESVLKPLKIIKVPVHEIAMMMSIALRFIPILLEETDKIMKAQLARGADFESGNILKKTKSLVPVLIPLFVSAFRRANDLAMAMEARCYRGGDGRTKMKPLKYKGKDFGAFLFLIAYMALIILCGIKYDIINGFIMNMNA